MKPDAKLPTIAGVVGLRNDPLRGHVLMIDGVPAPREGRAYLLPTAAGEPLRAFMKGRFASENPRLTIDGTTYFMGDATSPLLRIVTLLPLLFLFGGNVVTIVLAVVGLGLNFWILRMRRTETMKCGAMLAAFIVGVVIMTAWAFLSSWVMGLAGRP